MSGQAARVAAQAKVNLALQVGPRRPDGYHDLATLFARIDLADDVLVRIEASGVTVQMSRGGVPDESAGPPEKNLALLAARAYMDAARWPNGCAIEIEKRIPVGAGLGGGSADAGAVLRALNALAPRPLPIERLLRIAATLGADVPFLTLDAPLALGTDRGDAVRGASSARSAVARARASAVLDLDGRCLRVARRGPRRGRRARRALDPDRLRAASRDWESIAPVADERFPAGRVGAVPGYRRMLRGASRSGRAHRDDVGLGLGGVRRVHRRAGCRRDRARVQCARGARRAHRRVLSAPLRNE